MKGCVMASGFVLVGRVGNLVAESKNGGEGQQDWTWISKGGRCDWDGRGLQQ